MLKVKEGVDLRKYGFEKMEEPIENGRVFVRLVYSDNLSYIYDDRELTIEYIQGDELFHTALDFLYEMITDGVIMRV